MFRESPEQQAARLEAQKKDEEERENARAVATPFYKLGTFWLAASAIIVLGTGALAGSELLTNLVASLLEAGADAWSWFPDVSMPPPNITAAILLVSLWAVARIGVGAASYWYDPRNGSKVFYTHGLLGGYELYSQSYEPICLWAAWPIATVVGWILARVVAWIPFALWNWSYSLMFWIILGIYTVPTLAAFVYLGAEEHTDLLD
jgi:hypothetical protein